MSALSLRAAEGCDPDYSLLWDSEWDTAKGRADWVMADADEPHNRGGLRAKHMLDTAVIVSLFTDKRIDPGHPLYWLADGDPRGWWGDSVDVRDDLREVSLGSHLWLLERAPLRINGVPAAEWARIFALEALQPLLDQGVVVRIDAQARQSELKNRLELEVQLYGRAGELRYERKFDLVWNQVAR